MVRRSALQNYTILYVLAFLMASLVLATEAFGNARIERDGTIVFHPQALGLAEHSLEDSSGFELRLTYPKRFPLEALQLSFNGLLAKHPLLQGLAAASRWESSANGKRHVLIIALDDLESDQILLLQRMVAARNFPGGCFFKLNTYYVPLSVEFKRIYRHWHWKRHAPVYITKVDPKDKLTSSQSIVFNFSTPIGKTIFFCSIDGSRWQRCSSPMAYSKLKVGNHVFRVRALNRRFRLGPVSTYQWKIIENSPFVSITKTSPAEALTSNSSMTVYFTSRPGTTVQCQLDNRPKTVCKSPVTFSSLAEGAHKVNLSALEKNTLLATASHSWVIDRTAPLTQWDLTPPLRSHATHAEFRMSANETVTWKCALDGGTFYDCNSPAVLDSLTEGNHSVQVIATDLAGNASLPLNFQWTIDLTPPVVSLVSANPSQKITQSSDMSLHFSVSEPAKVACALNGIVVKEDCQSPIEFKGLPDGDYTATLTPTDAAQNVGRTLSYQWTVDTTSPVLTLQMESPKTLPTNQRTAQFSLQTTEAGAIRTFLDNSEIENSGSSIELFDLSEGTHTLRAYAEDSSGNKSAESVFTWTVDYTAPVISLDTITPNEAVTATNSISIDFHANEPATFQCSLDGAALTPCQAPFLANDLADGLHTFSVVGTDTTGNRSELSSYEWTVATYVTVQIDTESPTANPTNSRTKTFTFSSPNTSNFQCKLDSADAVPCSSPVQYTGLADGSHTFLISAIGFNGKIGGSDSRTWSIDATAPEIFLQSVVPSAKTTYESSLAITFTTSETATVYCSLDGGNVSVCSSPYSLSNLAIGPHTVSISASDALGNTAVPIRYDWTVEDKPVPPPVVTLTSMVPAAGTNNSTTMSIGFVSDRPSVQYFCSLDFAVATVCTSPMTYNFLAEGNHTFRVFAKDSKGQQGPTATYNWTTDLTGPSIQIQNTTPAATETNSHNFLANFTSSEAGNTFCSLDGSAATLCFSPFTANGIPNGTHTLSIYGEDLVGNRGQTVNYTWIIDDSAPVVTLTGMTPPWSPTANTSLTLSFSASKPSTFFCSLDGTSPRACQSPYTVSGLADGSHTLSVYAIDNLGNTGQAVSYNWSVDTTPIVITNFSVSNITNNSALVTWTTNIPATSQVIYGTSSMNQSVGPTSQYVTNHSVLLTGLSRFTFYTVQGTATDRDGRAVPTSTSTFRTLR